MSARQRLRGGVQPPSHKAASVAGPIRDLPLPSLLILPLGDNHLLPAPDSWVGKGEPIAHGSELPVRASTSGFIRGIETRAIDADCHGPCVLLEPDGDDRWREPPQPKCVAEHEDG